MADLSPRDRSRFDDSKKLDSSSGVQQVFPSDLFPSPEGKQTNKLSENIQISHTQKYHYMKHQQHGFSIITQ